MAEKFKYGPLVYNCFGEEDDSGNYWWPGNPPVGYEEESGVFRIPIDADGNQCLPGDCILHPNCKPERFTYHKAIDDNLPELEWCREWFEDNFLIIDDWTLCKYIFRWYTYNNQYESKWLEFAFGKTKEEMMNLIWPDVPKS